MTNKQREAIDRLKQLKDYSTTYYGSMYFKVEVKADDEMKETIDTVLSLIKEQQEEIGNLQKELNEENKRSMILANNDKFKEQVIELMSELVYERFKPELLLEYGFESKEQFKQYFAELVRKE